MARGINKVILVGNLGADPEIRYTGTGKPVANVSLAASEEWKDKDGEKQERTEWVRLVAFDGLAEILEKYTSKGSKIYVEGKLQTREWENKEGKTQYTTEVIVQQILLLDGRSNSDDRRPSRNDREERAPRQESRGRQDTRRQAEPEDDGQGFDDDIPF